MRNRAIVVASVAALSLASCTSINPYTGQTQISNTAGGATIGVLGGALAGAIIGGASGNARTGALIGAGVGGLTGAAIGNYMDQQEAELRAQLQGTGVSVTRVGDQIILNMPSNITFATGSAAVSPQFRQTLVSVSLVLQKYNSTLVDVVGHTDSTGSEESNLELSKDRAVAVATVIAENGVDSRRFYVDGRGEGEPIASNATEAGRAQNRRVELSIQPLRG